MPSRANVDAPIVLLGAGRSGTSLVTSLFDHHPDCSTVGETTNLIFGTWEAVRLAADVPALVENGRPVSDDERAGRVVRSAFELCFPDDRLFWMQKPIGRPNALFRAFEDETAPEAGRWYWSVLRTAFPRARYVVALRHPCDVVVSSRQRWGYEEGTLWHMLRTLAALLTHPDAPPIHVVSYEQLVRDRHATTRGLFEAVGVPFDVRTLAAFDRVHVPSPGRPDPGSADFSRREEWTSLDPGALAPADRRAIAELFARFGLALDWPSAFDAIPDDSARPEPTDAERISTLERQVADLRRRLRLISAEHREQVSQREAEVARIFREQRDWIAELERVQAWLQEQLEHARTGARRGPAGG